MLLASAAALSACGVEQTIDPVAAAATKTQAAGGMKVSMTVAVDAPSLAQPLTITAGGVLDQDAADLTMDLSSVLQAANLPVPGGQVELRFLQESGDPVVYLNAPFLSSFVPGGKQWLKVDLQSVGSKLGVDMSQLLGQANQNPAEILDMLRASGSIATVGTETVDGVSATHYSGTIDLDKAAGLSGNKLAQSAVQKLLASGAPGQVPVDVWVGDDGLIRRIVVDYHVTKDGQSAGAKVTLDLSDYGTAVSVSAPAADQVLDLTGLLGNAAERHAAAPTA